MKLNYIPDQEIDLLKNDLLGTLPYAETLAGIIRNCKTPFTMGLLGEWGSGKSSIIKTCEKDFINHPEDKIKIFIYDAWKYSQDSFKRTFILKLKKEFNLNNTQELEIFYTDKHEEISSKIGIIKGWWAYLILFVIIIPIINLKPFFMQKTFELTTFIISICFSAITTVITKTFVQYKISITKPKTFAPEQFEEIFEEIIAEITSQGNRIVKWIKSILKKPLINKVVIVIDNIDRCHRELAVELLLTIKNFLEIKNVVFILPVDEDGIKKFLHMSTQDADEFLRKLFNTTLRIKRSSDAELYDFALSLNKSYKLNLPPTVLSMISQEFSKNPRRIIQFLNVFQTEIALIEKQEQEGLIPKDVISKNLPMLAKIVIIREEWPDLYEKLSDTPVLLNGINATFGIKRMFPNKDGLYEIGDETRKPTLTEEQYRFFMRTQSIEAKDLELFFINKDVFEGIPDEVNSLVLSHDWEKLKKIILEKQITFERLFSFINNKIDKDVIKSRLMQTSGFNILSLIFKISSDPSFSVAFDKILISSELDKIKSIIQIRGIENLIFEFNSKELNSFAMKLNKKGFSSLTDKIVIAINGIDVKVLSNKEIETIKNFIEEFNAPEYLELIKNKFSQILSLESFNYYESFKDILEKPEILKHLITSDFTSFIESLQQDPNQNNTIQKVKILQSVNNSSVISEDLINLYISKIIHFINTSNWEFVSFWLKTLKGFIKKIKDDTIRQQLHNRLLERYNFLYTQYAGRNLIDVETYKEFLNVAKELYLSSLAANTQSVEWLNSFFNRNENSEIYLYINELFREIIRYFETYNWPFSQIVINRFISTGDEKQIKEFGETTSLMLEKSTSEKGVNVTQINSIIEKYLNILYKGSLEQSEEITKWLSRGIKNDYVKKFIEDKFSLITGAVEQKEVLDILIEIKDKSLLTAIIKNIFSYPENLKKDKIEEIRQKLDNTQLIAGVLSDILKGITTEDTNKYKSYINLFTELSNVKEYQIAAILIDKLRPLLAGDNKGDQMFAIDILTKIKIPREKKGLIKTLLKEMKGDNFTKEEITVLNEIKKKVK
ncbi:MAG: P-loop NTPase fold protein [bacterium]|nr:P-loop NTPase fold protein [bacterium]